MRNSATLLSLTTSLLLWSPAAGEAQTPLIDPGTGPWAQVAEEQVLDVCKLDPELLQQVTMRQDQSFAIVRYGRLCFVSGENASDGPGVSHLFSATKTLGALMTGAAQGPPHFRSSIAKPMNRHDSASCSQKTRDGKWCKE